MKSSMDLYKSLFIRIFICFCFSQNVLGQNLILDPGAETDPVWNGWTQKSGNWQMSAQVTPHGGAEHFYAGVIPVAQRVVGDTSELYQDINVSSNSASINAGTAVYTFSGWMRIYSAFNDIADIIVEYRDATGKVLSSYNTGQNTTLSWKQYTNVTTAPVGTVDIRIRLLSIYIQGSSSDGYMDDLSLTVNSVAPVKLISFTASPYNDSVAVYWTTASEKNNAYFTVEKSSNGTDWQTVSIVPGSGNSSNLISYISYDGSPFEGTSYYRLKQTDTDGNYSYSEVVVINFDVASAFQLFPNPASTDLHLKIGSSIAYSVSCVSISGESIPLSIKAQLLNETVYDVSGLSRGVYFLIIQTADKKTTKKFIVQ
jgi:hypothetical protein